MAGCPDGQWKPGAALDLHGGGLPEKAASTEEAE